MRRASARWGIGFVVAAGLSAPVTDAVAQAPPPLALHFEAPSGAVLLGRSGPTEDWQPVCTGPCYRFVDRSWTYSWRYSDGNGEFTLERVWPEGRARVVLLQPPPKAFGEVPLVAGAVAYGIGGALDVFALFSITDPNRPWVSDVFYTGLGLALAGTVLLIVGAIYKTSVPKSWTAEVTWFVPHLPVIRPTTVERETRGALSPPTLGVPIVHADF
ncbi:MAG TPA: hypothetical protein VGL81_04850 [Polyangiaceae bacterium]|jgi:hypothetical protein